MSGKSERPCCELCALGMFLELSLCGQRGPDRLVAPLAYAAIQTIYAGDVQNVVEIVQMPDPLSDAFSLLSIRSARCTR